MGTYPLNLFWPIIVELIKQGCLLCIAQNHSSCWAQSPPFTKNVGNRRRYAISMKMAKPSNPRATRSGVGRYFIYCGVTWTTLKKATFIHLANFLFQWINPNHLSSNRLKSRKILLLAFIPSNDRLEGATQKRVCLTSLLFQRDCICNRASLFYLFQKCNLAENL